VISVGNPALNPRIWDMYKQIFSGKLSDNTTTTTTTVEVNSNEVELQDIEVGVPQQLTFEIKNTGKGALAIADIKTSCGCTNAQWEKRPIKQGESTKIHVEFKKDNAGYFLESLQVYCNVDNSPIKLTINGNTKE
jgi:hypothetical protein